MKKILYIIPILLLFFITTEIYGFTFTEADGTLVESEFDPYKYIEEFPYYIIYKQHFYSPDDGYYWRYDFYFFETIPEYKGKSYWDGNDGGGFCYSIFKNSNYETGYFDGIVCYYENTLNGENSYYTDENGIKHYYKYYCPIAMYYNGEFITNTDKVSLYHNFEITYNDIVREPILYGDLQVKPSIEILCEYSSDYKTATLTANIKNSTGNEKLYYADDVIFNSGTNSGSSGTEHGGGGAGFGSEIDSLFKLYNDSLIYTENKVVTFRIYDNENNLITQKSYNINELGTFNSVSFNVNFDTSKVGYLIFTPTLDSTSNAYYSIYYKYISDSDKLIVTRNGSHVSDSNESTYTLLSNNEVVTMLYTGNYSTNVDLFFEIRNKTTGQTVLTRTYNYKISSMSNSSLNGSTENDVPIDGNGFSNLNENSTIDDIIEVTKTTFSSFGAMFGILPGFVWAFLGVALVVLIVLRILGR